MLAATDLIHEADPVAYELSEGCYPSGMRLKFGAGGDAYFCFVLDGALSDVTPERTITYAAGRLLFFPPARAYAIEFTEPTRCMIVRISPELLGRLRIDPREFCEVRSIQDWEATWMAKRLHAEFAKTNTARDLVIEAVILQLLALTVRSRGERPCESFWLRKVRAVLDDQYLRDYRLSELASLAGVHRVHLVREFRKNYGMTIGQHIRKLRIGHACDLLAGTDLLLRDIAAACRFVDQSHFSKQFKKLSGLTPAEYRNLIKTA